VNILWIGKREFLENCRTHMWIVYFAGREIFIVLILKSIEEWEGVMTKINSGL